MEVSKATQKDIDVIFDLLGALSRIEDGESLEESEEGEGISWSELQDAFDAGEDGYVPDRVNHYIRQAMEYLLYICRQGNAMRAVMNLSALLDPDNKIVDPQSSTLRIHPDIAKGLSDTERIDWLAEQDDIDITLGNTVQLKPCLRAHIDAAIQEQAAEAEAT